jgi:hypothetical protein
MEKKADIVTRRRRRSRMTTRWMERGRVRMGTLYDESHRPDDRDDGVVTEESFPPLCRIPSLRFSTSLGREDLQKAHSAHTKKAE